MNERLRCTKQFTKECPQSCSFHPILKTIIAKTAEKYGMTLEQGIQTMSNLNEDERWEFGNRIQEICDKYGLDMGCELERRTLT